MTREILLTRGYVARVDDEDYARVSAHTWYAQVIPSGARDGDPLVYAVRRYGDRDHWTDRRLHVDLLGDVPPRAVVAFKDGDTLNCTRSNIAIVSRTDLQVAMGVRRDNTSGYKGVLWHSANNRWQARIRVGGQRVHLGYFDTPDEAARAYNEAALRLHGPHAYQNTIAHYR